ncbi:MAG: hypothetical protein ACRELY_23630, partial [Polyangiaceae bacterium]
MATAAGAALVACVGDPPPDNSTDGGGSSDANVTGDSVVTGDGGCAVDQTTCGSTCVDLKTSATNCGKCGKSCLGGTCSASACSAYVVAKQPTTGAVAKLATDGTRIIWADTGLLAIFQIPASGGTPITLASNSATKGAIGTELSLAHGVVAFNYVGNSDPPAVGIAKVDAPDSGVAVANAGQSVDALSLSTSATHVFFINHGGTQASLDDYILADGGSGTGAGSGRFLSALASDDTYLF